MDTVRTWLAVLILAMLPGGILFWFSIHPFIRFWRRFSTGLVLTVHYAAALGLAGWIVWRREVLLGTDYGTNWWFFALGTLIFVCSALFRRRFQRELTNARLTGAPELDPSRPDNQLLRSGVYAHIRHPRYLQILGVLLGYALMVNYQSIYLTTLAYLLSLPPLIWLEERELSQRFGTDYEAYRRAVPWRFIPKVF
jgi:protein-S-isoprenylcysteine O-methyltransferase Ste14